MGTILQSGFDRGKPPKLEIKNILVCPHRAKKIFFSQKVVRYKGQLLKMLLKNLDLIYE
jgi:hypothetical protein